MSNYSHALNAAIEKDFDGKQSALSKRAGVPSSMVSRHCSGNFRPDAESLDKICSVLEPESGAQVAAAHLHDETPRSAKDLIQVSTRTTARQAFVDHQEPLPPAFTRLDPKTQRALEILAEAALDNDNARDALQHTAKFIGGDLDTPRPIKRKTRGVKPIPAHKLNES